MPGSSNRLRILVYTQHLSGVGHYVRSLEIARALSRQHTVYLTQGGCEVPRAGMDDVCILELPQIRRTPNGLAPVDGRQDIEQVMARRKEVLQETVTALHPDVIVVEHYPFSKWDLGDEIGELLVTARACEPGLKAICSVRDIPLQTRHEDCTADAYATEVLARLEDLFDAVMVHGDPELSCLDDHFTRAGDIRVPVSHTGIVSEKPESSGAEDNKPAPPTQGDPWVLVSAGGGADAVKLVDSSIAAWKGLRSKSELSGYKLVVCTGLAQDDAALVQSVQDDDSIVVQPFTPEFLHWMQGAALSVSCAGYNTCANLLETGCRSILVPNPKMSDQLARARHMQTLGVAEVVLVDVLNSEMLGQAMLRALQGPLTRHHLALDGADRACAFIEGLAL